MILKIPLCGPGISGRTDALNAAVLSTCAAHSLTKELPYLFISVAALGAFSRAVPTQAAWIGSGSGYDRCPPPRGSGWGGGLRWCVLAGAVPVLRGVPAFCIPAGISPAEHNADLVVIFVSPPPRPAPLPADVNCLYYYLLLSRDLV